MAPEVPPWPHTPVLRATLEGIRVAESGLVFSFFGSIPIAWARILRSWKHDPNWSRGAWPVFALPLVWLVGFPVLVCGLKEVAD
jgi:hypothetical protein